MCVSYIRVVVFFDWVESLWAPAVGRNDQSERMNALPLNKGGQQISARAGLARHCPCHFGGIAIGHTGDKIDDAYERAMEWPVRIGCVIAQQVENATIFE